MVPAPNACVVATLRIVLCSVMVVTGIDVTQMELPGLMA